MEQFLFMTMCLHNGEGTGKGSMSCLLVKVLRGLIPVGLLFLWLLVHKRGWINTDAMLELVEPMAVLWWLPFIMALAMALLFATALPGSSLIIVSGLLYPPGLATVMTVVGGTVGSMLGYGLARKVPESLSARLSKTTAYKALRRRTTFLVLLTLRILPGMPHGMLNYSAGLLGANRFPFIASAICGYAIKGFLYTSAANDIASFKPGDPLSFSLLWPFVALALLATTAILAERKLLKRHRALDTIE